MAAGERTVILAEGFSGDPHYGKTMRGVLRYRRDDVVVIVDSRRDGGRRPDRCGCGQRALGLGVMLGCMIESGLGIAAGCQVASLCDHVDLDGNLLLAEDPCPGVELVDGVQLPSNEPGLGVRPSRSWAVARDSAPEGTV